MVRGCSSCALLPASTASSPCPSRAGRCAETAPALADLAGPAGLLRRRRLRLGLLLPSPRAPRAAGVHVDIAPQASQASRQPDASARVFRDTRWTVRARQGWLGRRRARCRCRCCEGLRFASWASSRADPQGFCPDACADIRPVRGHREYDPAPEMRWRALGSSSPHAWPRTCATSSGFVINIRSSCTSAGGRVLR